MKATFLMFVTEKIVKGNDIIDIYVKVCWSRICKKCTGLGPDDSLSLYLNFYCRVPTWSVPQDLHRCQELLAGYFVTSLFE